MIFSVMMWQGYLDISTSYQSSLNTNITSFLLSVSGKNNSTFMGLSILSTLLSPAWSISGRQKHLCGCTMNVGTFQHLYVTDQAFTQLQCKPIHVIIRWSEHQRVWNRLPWVVGEVYGYMCRTLTKETNVHVPCETWRYFTTSCRHITSTTIFPNLKSSLVA